MEDNTDQPKSGLHGLFVVLSYIANAIFALAIFLLTLNWLDDFLHAPIGIKDNPPEPGILVQTASLVWIPLLLTVVLFGFLRFGSRVFSTVSLLLGTIIVTCGSVSLVGGILSETKKQYFEGQQYFTQTVTPVLYILFLMAWVGVGANHCIMKWKKGGKVRHGIAGLFLLLAIICGLCGLFVAVKNNDSGGLLVLIGMLLLGFGIAAYNANTIVGRPE